MLFLPPAFRRNEEDTVFTVVCLFTFRGGGGEGRDGVPTLDKREGVPILDEARGTYPGWGDTYLRHGEGVPTLD